ncbi:hypothetical protein POM88_019851 [Heracleum sosnowskyi]|uniref:Ubiquitin-like protease family profile domain-containing protein n=1 Tax=Heracleum sosnowskyi TaxID=360622 RepID=A0AAD8IAR2_9APIA|nr:hypothetical protein POM88_019851 [Heracleum sosnowskyi]
MELDQEGAGQPNVVTNTRIVDFDDDDDFATPQPKTKRSAPITKTKRRLNVEDMGQEEQEKTKGKKLRIINKNPKFGLVDKESGEVQLGDVDAKKRNKKKTKTAKEPNEDKWDGKVGKAGKVNVTEKFKVRNSPNTLTYMVTNLSDQQKQWVISTGFKHILDFRLGKIPHRLACSVLEAFDAETCSLKLQGESIAITDQDVYNVLGLPNGDTIFTLATEDKALERHNLWKEEFGKNNITTAAVAERIKESQEADDQFKLSFLMVLSNVLIESQTGSYVYRDILGFDIQLDDCNQYNWGEFLLRCLVKTKANWRKTTRSLFYTGPIIFLIIFYVDRVIFKGLTPVERKFPAFKNWTMELLKQRQNYEKQCGNFKENLVIRQQAEIDQIMKDDQGVEESNTSHEDHQNNAGQDGFVHMRNDETIPQARERQEEQPGQTVDKFICPGQHEAEEKEENWFETLTTKATTLISVMDAYMFELESAKAKHPDDKNISELQAKVIGMLTQLKEKTESSTTSKSKDTFESDHIETNIGLEVTVKENNVSREKRSSEEYLIDPLELDHIELIEYLYSSQGKKDMEMDMQELSVPSFSLGTDLQNSVIDICKKISREHGDDTIVEQESDKNTIITPMPQQLIREKREKKIIAAYRSPYVQREIDINTKYSTQEYAVWRWIIQKGKDDIEHVFNYGEQYCIREHMATLRPGEKIYTSVIDVWCTLLNDKEKYKSPESPLRLFFNVGFSVGPLDDNKSEEDQYERFGVEMNHFFEKNPDKKIEDHNLIFFPIFQDEHYYLICINLKKASFEVIDNIRVGKAGNKEYGRYARKLKNHFVKYLEEKDLKSLAKTIKKVKVSYLSMTWQTFQNYKDCGAFLMRHMETYKGKLNKWNTQLKTEKMGQKGQMDKLRTKYAHAILTSHLNERRHLILDEAKSLYDKIATKKLMSIVIAASSRKQKREKISGTVLFPDDQTTAEKTTTHISVGTCDSKKMKTSRTVLFPDEEKNAEQKTIEEEAAQKTIVNGSTTTHDRKELQT